MTPCLKALGQYVFQNFLDIRGEGFGRQDGEGKGIKQLKLVGTEWS